MQSLFDVNMIGLVFSIDPKEHPSYGSVDDCRGKSSINRDTEPLCRQIDNGDILSSHASLLGCNREEDDDSSTASPRDRELYVCAENCKCKICVSTENGSRPISVGSIQSENSRLLNT